MDKAIIEYARSAGYDNAEYCGMWKNYKVYAPRYNSKEVLITGLPLKILVDENTIRMTDADEALEIGFNCGIDELLFEYADTFGENFPTFPLMGSSDDEMCKIIRECLDKGKNAYELGYVKEGVIH